MSFSNKGLFFEKLGIGFFSRTIAHTVKNVTLCFYGSLMILGVTFFLFKGEFCLQMTFQQQIFIGTGRKQTWISIVPSLQWLKYFPSNSTTQRWPHYCTPPICANRGNQKSCTAWLGLVKFTPGTTQQLKRWGEHATLCPGATRALMQCTSQQQFPHTDLTRTRGP